MIPFRGAVPGPLRGYGIRRTITAEYGVLPAVRRLCTTLDASRFFGLALRPPTPTMKRAFFSVTLALGPSLVFAQTIQNQSDINDTVYLQQANAGMAAGNAIGNPVTAAPGTQAPTYGSPQYMQQMQSFQQYQDNMNVVVGAHDDVVRKQRDYQHLLEEADFAAKTKDADERRHYFGNYLVDSRNFLRDHPEAPPRLWVLRAIAAVQLDKEATGKEAGHMILTSLPEKDREDPHVRTLLRILRSKGWLTEAANAAAPVAPPK